MTAVAARARASMWARAVAMARTHARGGVVPLMLFGLALLLGLVAATVVRFPHGEGSAYYVAVAENLVAGRGLVIDALWSYATPPLALPRAAFELWQPMASLVAAGPMLLFGATFGAAQLGHVATGAALAPLAWAVTREAAPALGLSTQRAAVLAVGSGTLVAVSAPLLLAQAVPDSTLPFAVFAVLACWLVPRALRGGPQAAVGLGAVLGLAYLSRHEAVWIGAALVSLAWAAGRLELRRLAWVALGGAVVVGPWLLRNLFAFGTPLPGQAVDNALLTYNEQIFAYLHRPSLEAFLAQGLPVIAGNMVAGVAHNLVEVLLLSAFPVGVAGLAGAALVLRWPDVRSTALGALLMSGGLIFALTGVLFPVATRWGTFQHAAGPLIVGLAVAAVLAADRLIAAIGRARGWQRANAWLGPVALVVIAATVAAFQVLVAGMQAEASRDRVAGLAAAVLAQPEATSGGRPTLITDRPIWLSQATGLPAMVLPREPAEAVLRLVDDLAAGSALIVLSDARLDPRTGTGWPSACFVARPLPDGAPAGALVLAVTPGCAR